LFVLLCEIWPRKFADLELAEISTALLSQRTTSLL
jgi:hypothetical protein